MIRRPPRSTQSRSSAASDVYKRQIRAREHDARLRRRDPLATRHAVEARENEAAGQFLPIRQPPDGFRRIPARGILRRGEDEAAAWGLHEETRRVTGLRSLEEDRDLRSAAESEMPARRSRGLRRVRGEKQGGGTGGPQRTSAAQTRPSMNVFTIQRSSFSCAASASRISSARSRDTALLYGRSDAVSAS